MMFIVDFDHYRQNPGEIFSLATLQAGGVFYGGLMLALVVAWWYMRKTQLPLLADRRRLRARHRAGPRHRPPGLLLGGMLLGHRVPSALGSDVHQSGRQRSDRRSARTSPAPDAALRSLSPSSLIFAILYRQFQQAAHAGRDHQPVSGALRNRALHRRVLPLPRAGQSLGWSARYVAVDLAALVALGAALVMRRERKLSPA